MTPEEIIDFRNREQNRQDNIRSIWQDTSNYVYPYVNITSTFESGSARTKEIYDITPMLDTEDMISALKHVLLPIGQPFFSVKVGSGVDQPDHIQRYLSMLTDVAHDHIFNSNLIQGTEFDEVLRSLIIFGPASVYSDWTVKDGLNYRNAVIGTYQLIENSKKLVDGIIITIQYTPRQAIDEFGEDVGEEVVKASKDPKKASDKFEFIYTILPRGFVNPNLSQDVTDNMPWEETVVNVKEKKEVYKGGYRQFPYHTARWKRPADEKDGRGICTEILPQIKVLQRMNRDFNEVGNKWANPAMDVLDSVEGAYRTFPGARNTVSELPSAKAIDQGLNGNFPITEKALDRQTALIDRALFKNAFSPLEDLTGDRRTTLEIRERIRQMWPKIGSPVGRIWYELLSPLVERSILLLIRNGVVVPPPPELVGAKFGLEFVGPFALELKSQQSKAFQEWAGIVGAMEQVFPGAVDNVDSDDAIMRLGRTLGVNAEDMASSEQRAAKRQERADQMAKLEAAQAAQVAGETYKNTSGAAEAGSPAGAAMGVQ